MNFRKILSVLLTLCMLCGIFSSVLTAYATVELPSYTVVTLDGGKILVYDSYYEIWEADSDIVLSSVEYDTNNIVLCGQTSHVYLHTNNTVHFHDFTASVQEGLSESALFLFWETDIYINGVCSFTSVDDYGVKCNSGSGVSFNPVLTQNSSLTINSPDYAPIFDEIPTTLVDGNADEYIFYTASGIPAKHTVTTIKENNTCVYRCGECDIIDGAVAPHTAGENGYTYNGPDKCTTTCAVCNTVFSVAHKLGQYRYHEDDPDWCHQYCTVCDTDVYSSGHSYTYTEIDGGHSSVCEDCGYVSSDVAEPHDFLYAPVDGKYCIEVCQYCGATGEKIEHSFEKGYYNSYDNNFCVKACDNCGGPGGRYISLDMLKSHDFSDYEYYDDEYCVVICADCGEWNYTYDEESDYYVPNLVPHEHESFNVSGTDIDVDSTTTKCENCGDRHNNHNYKNSFEINIYPYDYTATTILIIKDGKPWQAITSSDASSSGGVSTHTVPYDPNSTYEFKLIGAGSAEDEVVIFKVDENENGDMIFNDYLIDYKVFDTLCTVNSSVDPAALAYLSDLVKNIGCDLEAYTEDSVKAVVDALAKVDIYNLPTNLSDFLSLTDELKDAINALERVEENEYPVSHGYISPANYPITITDDGYYIHLPDDSLLSDEETDIETPTDVESPTDVEENDIFVPYTGDYTIINPFFGEYFFTANNAITIEAKDVNITLVNAMIFNGMLDIAPGSNVNLTLVGNNVFLDDFCPNIEDESDTKAGIHVPEGASLTINDCDGTLIVVGEDNAAGIGGHSNESAGNITINGGYVFAFSTGDGAGIGGGYNGGAGNITINGGYIFAQCITDDGAGIGCGDGGNGGTIVINDGRVIAVSDYDDGAGIGGANGGQIYSITINGGIITVGASSAAGIGGGQESDTNCGNILINGGVIVPYRTHNFDECLVGNGSANSSTDDCKVVINGGNILSNFIRPIMPTAQNDMDEKLVETTIDIPKGADNETFCFALSDGSKIYARAYYGRLTVYIPEGVTIKSMNKLTDGDLNGDGTVNAADALEVLQAAVGKIKLRYEQSIFANVDGDDKLAASDALSILQFAVGKISEFAK